MIYVYVLHLRMTQKGINTIFVRLWRTDFLYQFFASSNFGVNLNRQDRTRPPVVFPREKRPSITIWLQLIMCKFEGLTCVLEKVVNSDLHGTLGSLGCFWTLLFPHSGTKKSGWQTTSPQVKMLGSPLDGLKKGQSEGQDLPGTTTRVIGFLSVSRFSLWRVMFSSLDFEYIFRDGKTNRGEYHILILIPVIILLTCLYIPFILDSHSMGLFWQDIFGQSSLPPPSPIYIFQKILNTHHSFLERTWTKKETFSTFHTKLPSTPNAFPLPRR